MLNGLLYLFFAWTLQYLFAFDGFKDDVLLFIKDDKSERQQVEEVTLNCIEIDFFIFFINVEVDQLFCVASLPHLKAFILAIIRLYDLILQFQLLLVDILILVL